MPGDDAPGAPHLAVLTDDGTAVRVANAVPAEPQFYEGMVVVPGRSQVVRSVEYTDVVVL